MYRKKIICIGSSAAEERRLSKEVQERLGYGYEVLPCTGENAVELDTLVQSILAKRPVDTLVVMLTGGAPELDAERLLCTVLAAPLWSEQHNYSSLHDCFSRRILLVAPETETNTALAEKYHVSFAASGNPDELPARYSFGRRIAEKLRSLY